MKSEHENKNKITSFFEKCLSNPGFYSYIISFVTIVLCLVILLHPDAYIVAAHFNGSDQNVKIGYLRYCLAKTSGTTCSWIFTDFQQIQNLTFTKNSDTEVTALLDLTATFQNPLLITISITSVVSSLVLVCLITIVSLFPNNALIKDSRIQEFHPAQRDNVPFPVLTRRVLTITAQVVGFFSPACWCILAISSYLMVDVARQLSSVATKLIITSGTTGFSVVWVLCAGSAIMQSMLYVILTFLTRKKSAAYV